MGCDIHSVTEVRINGKWVKAKVKPFGDRCYDSFAILANVRNGTGFAGCVTGQRLKPIAEPRGIPSDAADPDDDYGDHSFSHVALAELLAVDWNTGRLVDGTVSVAEFIEFREKGKPAQWCGSVGGDAVMVVSVEETVRRIAANDWTLTEAQYQEKDRELARYGRTAPRGAKFFFYTRVSWNETYEVSASSLHGYMTEVLVPLADDVGPENVRMVFGFDS